MPYDASESSVAQMRRDARVSGLGDANPPTLKAVDRRRFELWSVASFMALGLGIALILPSLWPALPEPVSWAKPSVVRALVLILMVGLSAYVIEKAVALRRLRRLLLAEQGRVAHLSSRVDQLASLLAVAKAMNSERSLRDVLAIILESAVEFVTASGGSIMLVEDPAHLKAVCTMSNDGARGARVLVGQGFAGRVAATREPVVMARAFGGRDYRDAVEIDAGAESAMAVPLVGRGELMGVLTVFSAARDFGEADLRPLTLFAEHAAISIVNARHYETERRRVAELLELNRTGAAQV